MKQRCMGDDKMIRKLSNELKRRKEQRCHFYFQGIGNTIRKRRLELDLTQEALAKGICSNTYISKIENNAIVANKENLYLIMERMDMPYETIVFPEEMVEILDRSFQCFYEKNIEHYSLLMEDIQRYHLGILVQIAKLGYYVLCGHIPEARSIYVDMFRYLSSLEEHGLSIFIIYAIQYNIMIMDFAAARKIIQMTQNTFFQGDSILAMYHFSQYVVDGFQYRFSHARMHHDVAQLILNAHHNTLRLKELMSYYNMFLLFEGNIHEVDVNLDICASLNPIQKNLYLLMFLSSGVETYPKLFDPNQNAPLYPDCLVFLGLRAMKESHADRLKDIQDQIDAFQAIHPTTIDYKRWLDVSRDPQKGSFKDFIVQKVLPFYECHQLFFVYHVMTQEAVTSFRASKRYKDALVYQEKCMTFLEHMQ